MPEQKSEDPVPDCLQHQLFWGAPSCSCLSKLLLKPTKTTVLSMMTRTGYSPLKLTDLVRPKKFNHRLVTVLLPQNHTCQELGFRFLGKLLHPAEDSDDEEMSPSSTDAAPTCPFPSRKTTEPAPSLHWSLLWGLKPSEHHGGRDSLSPFPSVAYPAIVALISLIHPAILVLQFLAHPAFQH